MTFTPQVVSGIHYSVQSSTDLTNWTDNDIPAANLTIGEPFTFIDSIDIHPAGPAKRFLRLRVAAP